MKKPLRQRIADAITVLKGEPLPIDVPMPKCEITKREVRTIAAWHIYPASYFAPNIPKEVLRKRAEEKLCYELAQCLMREGVIQFREDDYEPALFAKVRVIVPAEGD
jgi:hypothetical protein